MIMPLLLLIRALVLLAAPLLVRSDTTSSRNSPLLRGDGRGATETATATEHRRLVGWEDDDPEDPIDSSTSSYSVNSNNNNNHPVLDEAAFPWCGEYLSGFRLVRKKYDEELEGGGESQKEVLDPIPLENDAVISRTDFAHLAIQAETVSSVGVVRFYLPHREENVITAPFTIAADWLSQYDGQVVTLRADAFEAGYEKFLGTCEQRFRVQVSDTLDCPGAISGFYLTDAQGRKNEQVRDLRNGQVIPMSVFSQEGTEELSVSLDKDADPTTIKAVSFVAPESQAHILVHLPPYQVRAGIDKPGTYHIVARASADEAFTEVFSECEITFHVVEDPTTFLPSGEAAAAWRLQEQQRLAASKKTGANTWIGQASYADDAPNALAGRRRLGGGR